MDSKKRLRSDSVDSLIDSVEPKHILLDIVDDLDVNSVSQDLDSFIKTFEDEITPAPEHFAGVSDFGESARPELGFLFEASDDELGLPPTSLAESVELSELWKSNDELTGYDNSFEYEFGYYGNYINNYKNDDDVAIDGLFEHTDSLWQPETIPA